MTEAQQALLAESERSIQASSLLASQGFYGYAVSRAYYAMFYVAEAFLLDKGLTFSRHAAVIAAFGQHFAKSARAAGTYHRNLIEAFEMRQASDYASSIEVTSAQCQVQISRAREFLDLACKQLGKPA